MNQSDDSMSTLSTLSILATIEVLDTRQNSSNATPTPMNHRRGGYVARFLKETNEIIIVRGINLKDFQATELKK